MTWYDMFAITGIISWACFIVMVVVFIDTDSQQRRKK